MNQLSGSKSFFSGVSQIDDLTYIHASTRVVTGKKFRRRCSRAKSNNNSRGGRATNDVTVEHPIAECLDI